MNPYTYGQLISTFIKKESLTNGAEPTGYLYESNVKKESQYFLHFLYSNEFKRDGS
jgi:hypothetical protein